MLAGFNSSKRGEKKKIHRVKIIFHKTLTNRSKSNKYNVYQTKVRWKTKIVITLPRDNKDINRGSCAKLRLQGMCVYTCKLKNIEFRDKRPRKSIISRIIFSSS